LSAPLLPGPFWLIGCGNMAGAMLEGWLASGIDPSGITVIRPSGRAIAPGVRVLKVLPEGEVPRLVMLGVKPQKLDEVVPVLSPVLDQSTILISILAGVEQSTLRARFPAVRNIVKAMPNTPVRLRKGVVNLYSDGEPDACRIVEALMTTLGHVERFDDERLFQIAGHLTGAGPAFLFRFIDALAYGGAALGLPEDQSARLAAAMVEGAGSLAAGSAESPLQLAERVASPGGTTRAGLNVLDEHEALNRLLGQTLEASSRRSLEMAAEARGQSS
jgi:pyrroline-5-carboxylate reductase